MIPAGPQMTGDHHHGLKILVLQMESWRYTPAWALNVKLIHIANKQEVMNFIYMFLQQEGQGKEQKDN